MKILFERTEGFSGRKLQGTLDSSDLPPNQVHQLKELLKKSRFFELSAELCLSSHDADQLNYSVTVENENGRQTVEASDGKIPGEIVLFGIPSPGLSGTLEFRDQDCRITFAPQCARTRSVVLPNNTSRMGLWP
jgi:hypothetical protein